MSRAWRGYKGDDLARYVLYCIETISIIQMWLVIICWLHY